MSHRIEQSSPCRVVLTATLPAERVGAEREKVVAEWMRGVRVDGFRKGKSPRHLVERRYAKEIEDDLAERLVHTVWDEVRAEDSLRPAGPLEVRDSGVKPDGSFELSAELDVFPKVELPALDGFKAPEVDIEPKADEVEKYLEGLRERQAQWEPADDEPVDEGLLVEAEVHGSFPAGGGEPFHEERSLFRLGAGEVFPEIEAAVRGRKVGDEVAAERVLGEDAGPEKMGTRIAYTIKVKGVRRKRVPELDDAFATSLGLEGLPALRDKATERLRFEGMKKRRDAWRAALVAYLAGGQELALPEHLLDEETRKELVDLASAFAERGIDPRQGIEWDKIHPEVRERVAGRLRGELLLDAAAKELGISIDDAEVDAEVERQARAMGIPFAELKGNLGKRGGLDRMRGVIARERAFDEIVRRGGGTA
jgi:trigger factor